MPQKARRYGRSRGRPAFAAQSLYHRVVAQSSKPPPSASESLVTVRARILQALRDSPLTAREISQRASVPERDVAEHLRHIEHSLAHGDERLQTLAAHCVPCGFVFEARERHKRPSRCPRCKSERISPPRFQLER